MRNRYRQRPPAPGHVPWAVRPSSRATRLPASHLVDASREASLVVVGRRIRRGALGTHIGPVTHAVLHHSIAPVAVVPHN
jgi:nucleotide-binding universal stress UspA family protein